MRKIEEEKKHEECFRQMLPIRDALDVIHGKWKLMIIISMMLDNKRFKEMQRSIPKITSKVLAKELKELEQHRLIKRTVYDGYPVLIEYSLTPYAETLKGIMKELHVWGQNHRKIMFDSNSNTI